MSEGTFWVLGRDIFDFGGGFVALAVEDMNDLELEVGDAVRIVWCCVNEELYCPWRLSRKSLEGNTSNDGGRAFGVVMWANSLEEVFCSGGSCRLGKVTGPRKVMVVEMVVGMVRGEVLNNLVVMMELVMLVLPMVRGWMRETEGRRVWVTQEVLWLVVKEMLVWGMEGLMRGIVADHLGLSESSGKTSHTVSHSFLNSFSMRAVVGVDGVSFLK